MNNRQINQIAYADLLRQQRNTIYLSSKWVFIGEFRYFCLNQCIHICLSVLVIIMYCFYFSIYWQIPNMVLTFLSATFLFLVAYSDNGIIPRFQQNNLRLQHIPHPISQFDRDGNPFVFKKTHNKFTVNNYLLMVKYCFTYLLEAIIVLNVMSVLRDLIITVVGWEFVLEKKIIIILFFFFYQHLWKLFIQSVTQYTILYKCYMMIHTQNLIQEVNGQLEFQWLSQLFQLFMQIKKFSYALAITLFYHIFLISKDLTTYEVLKKSNANHPENPFSAQSYLGYKYEELNENDEGLANFQRVNQNNYDNRNLIQQIPDSNVRRRSPIHQLKKINLQQRYNYDLLQNKKNQQLNFGSLQNTNLQNFASNAFNNFQQNFPQNNQQQNQQLYKEENLEDKFEDVSQPMNIQQIWTQYNQPINQPQQINQQQFSQNKQNLQQQNQNPLASLLNQFNQGNNKNTNTNNTSNNSGNNNMLSQLLNGSNSNNILGMLSQTQGNQGGQNLAQFVVNDDIQPNSINLNTAINPSNYQQFGKQTKSTPTAQQQLAGILLKGLIGVAAPKSLTQSLKNKKNQQDQEQNLNQVRNRRKKVNDDEVDEDDLYAFRKQQRQRGRQGQDKYDNGQNQQNQRGRRNVDKYGNKLSSSKKQLDKYGNEIGQIKYIQLNFQIIIFLFKIYLFLLIIFNE